MDSSKVHESEADKSLSVCSKRTQSESTVSFKDSLPKRAKAVRSEGPSPEPLESLQTSLTEISNRSLFHTSLDQLSESDSDGNSLAETLPRFLISRPLDSINEPSHFSSTAVPGASQAQYSDSAEEMANEDTSSSPSSDSTIMPIVKVSPLPAVAIFAHGDTRKKIISYLTCYSERTFRPFFKQGMLRNFLAQPRLKGDDQPDYGDVSDLNRCEIMADNFEFPELLTSKLFVQDYTEAFYSQNYFEFDDPRAARWFFKSIGRRNFTSLNNIRFNIYGGFGLIAHSRSSLTGRSFEELWVEVFNFLKYRHRFRQLVISVPNMPGADQIRQDVESDKLTVEDVEDRAVYLARLPRAIENIRGLKKAHLTDWTGEVFPDQASMQRCSLLMQQARLVYDRAKDMRNLSLSSTLARVKASTAKARLDATSAATQQTDDENEEQEEEEQEDKEDQENKFQPLKSSVIKRHGLLPNRHQQLRQKHSRQAPRRPTTRVRQIREEEDYYDGDDDASITKKMQDTDLDLDLDLDLEFETTTTTTTTATDPAMVTPWRISPAGSQPGSVDWDWMNSQAQEKKESDDDDGDDDDDIKSHYSGGNGQGSGQGSDIVGNIGRNKFYGRKKRVWGEL